MKSLIYVSNIGSFLYVVEVCKWFLKKEPNSEFVFLLSNDCLDQKIHLKNVKISRKLEYSLNDIENVLKNNFFNNVYIGISSLKDYGEKYLCLLAKKHNIKTWTIQDYPKSFGFFNSKCIPDIVILFDKNSFSDCKNRFINTSPILINSPKHIFFQGSDKLYRKLKKNSNNQQYKCQLSIAFQPLIPTINFYLNKIINLLEKRKITFDICLHPSQFNNNDLINTLRRNKNIHKINNNIEANTISLFNARFIITCFSSIVIDLDKGLGDIFPKCEKLYCLEDNSCYKYINKDINNKIDLYKPKNINFEYLNNVENCIEDISTKLKQKPKLNLRNKKILQFKKQQVNLFEKQIDSLFQLLI